MSIASSAGGQNVKVGIRDRACDRRALGQLPLHAYCTGSAAAVDRGWKFFWRQRGIEDPDPVSNSFVGSFGQRAALRDGRAAG